jgi:hypothetical protein
MSSTYFEPVGSSSYSYGTVRLTCISISSLVVSRECSILLPTGLLILNVYLIPYHNCIYNRHPEDESSGSKHVEDIKIKNSNINLDNLHFAGFSCIIIQ